MRNDVNVSIDHPPLRCVQYSQDVLTESTAKEKRFGSELGVEDEERFAAMITLDNVHQQTVYALRQEVERLGLKLPEKINHDSLMQCLISRLVEEKQREEREQFTRLEQQREEKRETLLAAKEKRKAAAVQRSLERRARATASNNATTDG